MPLKELEARYATKRAKDYKLADGGGLYLLVRANGSKLWRMKYHFGGKEKLLSFARCPNVGLADARLRRAEAKVALRQGRDPGARVEVEPITTFEAAAREWHANRSASLDPGHASRLMTRLERDAFPALWMRDLRSITSADVVGMVRSVEARGALDVSRRLKQHVSQIFRFSIPQGWADNDPAACLSGLLKPKPRTRHMARVGLSDLPQLVRAIDGYDGAEPLWRVPAERMKMEREHLVPLAPKVVALLGEVGAYSTGGYVFGGDKLGQPISQNTMIYGCYCMGYRGRQTVHGFRGLASTWANEAECYRPDWIEMALAHADRDDVRSAYNSALYLTPRRRMLEAWADLVSGLFGGCDGKLIR
jgi:integrase